MSKEGGRGFTVMMSSRNRAVRRRRGRTGGGALLMLWLPSRKSDCILLKYTPARSHTHTHTNTHKQARRSSLFVVCLCQQKDRCVCESVCVRV